MSSDLRPGDRVFGPTQEEVFEITDFLGHGSFGLVYKVRDTAGVAMALKTIVTAYLGVDQLNSLLNEGALAMQIRHPNVLRVSYFHDGKVYPTLPPYMIMEYANQGTLEDALERSRTSNAFFTNVELRGLWTQLASGMKAVNERLVHRDLKPDNILIMNDILKIADFGLSKLADAATRSKTFKGINHVKYCAPEAWRLDKNLPSMDMYSMGVVFYEMATLRHPYTVPDTGDLVEAWKNAHFFEIPAPPKKFNGELDIVLAQVIMKMLSKRPEDRYKSWDEVVSAMEGGSGDSEQRLDMSWLVGHAVEKYSDRERAKLEAKKREIQKKEFDDLVAFSFEEIVQKAQEIVNSFNEQSEFIKLRLVRSAKFHFTILRDGGAKQVAIVIEPVLDAYLMNKRRVLAWGHLKAPSGRGFNLLLVASDADDLYGKWESLYAAHQVGLRRTDGRPEPFPFEFSELPEELQLLSSMHIYKTTKEPFKSEYIQVALQELM